MKITFEGRDWDLDENAITLKQGVVLHMTYGFTVDEWIGSLGKFDPRAFHFLYWLMLQQNGVVKPIADTDAPLVDFAGAWAEARQAQMAAEAAAAEPEPEPVVPTVPAAAGDQQWPGRGYPMTTTPVQPVPQLAPVPTGY